MNYKDIGSKLQKAREETGLSQEGLAKLIGCTQSSLSNYELGKRRLYLADLKHVGDILGKPVEYFLADNDDDDDKYAQNDDISTILKEPYIKDILLELHKLTISKRKSVLDFIKWQGKEENDK